MWQPELSALHPTPDSTWLVAGDLVPSSITDPLGDRAWAAPPHLASTSLLENESSRRDNYKSQFFDKPKSDKYLIFQIKKEKTRTKIYKVTG